MPFTGQGSAADPKTGGLVGIDCGKHEVLFATPQPPSTNNSTKKKPKSIGAHQTMSRITRRNLLKLSAAGVAAVAVPSFLTRAGAAGPNEEVRLAVIGLGGIDVPGSVGGRGRQLIGNFRKVPGARIAALCDCDQAILDHSVKQFQERGETPVTFTDLRKAFDDKSIDAVLVALPNFWHGLATVWACQAGKDVYCEKPFSYDIWEGRQMVAAARKYNRVVQVGTQRRSSKAVPQAIEYLKGGELGRIRLAHALIYRPRDGIGKATEPTPVPKTVDLDLWCGPVEKSVPRRKHFHYEWHWFWNTGNGEIGNNGPHHVDVARWILGQEQAAPRAISIGGRFGPADDAETADTQLAFFDYQPAPLICEVRNFRASKETPIGKYRGATMGVVTECEGGYVVSDFSNSTVYDAEGKKLKEFAEPKTSEVEAAHAANFIEAVRSHDPRKLHAEAIVGHASVACCHMANVSHRLGKHAAPEAIAETLKASRGLGDAFERCREYLDKNGLDLSKTKATIGPWLTLDATTEQFTGAFADEANRLSRRQYRAPYAVPEIA